MAGEKRLGPDHESACSQFDQPCKDTIEVTFAAGSEDMELQPKAMGRRQHLTCVGLRKSGRGRVDKERHDVRRGKKLVQQFQHLRRYFLDQLGRARDVAARPAQAGDKAELDWIGANFEHDRDGRGRRLCRDRRRSAGRGNHRHLTPHQIGHQCRQPVISVLRPAVFDRHVAAFK